MIAIKKDNIKTQDTTVLQTEDDVNNVRLFDHDVKLSPIFRNIQMYYLFNLQPTTQ